MIKTILLISLQRFNVKAFMPNNEKYKNEVIRKDKEQAKKTLSLLKNDWPTCGAFWLQSVQKNTEVTIMKCLGHL